MNDIVRRFAILCRAAPLSAMAGLGIVNGMKYLEAIRDVFDEDQKGSAS